MRRGHRGYAGTMDLMGALALMLVIGAAVAFIVGRPWVLLLALLPAASQLGAGNADSGPRWLLTLLFVSAPVATGMGIGLLIRRHRQTRT